MRRVDFADGNVTQDIIKTALPMLVAQVLNLLYSIVDRIYIGRIPGAGTASLGAVGLCFPIIMIVAAFTNMYGMGGAPLFAMELGRSASERGRNGNTSSTSNTNESDMTGRSLPQAAAERARQIMNTAFRLLVITSVALTLISELLGAPLLRLFGATAAELPASLSYLRIYMLGTLPLMISTGMNAYINAQGYAITGMLTVAIGAVANLLLDPLFIFTLGMGVAGAAIATVLSQILSLVVVMRFLRSERNAYPLSFDLRAGELLPFAGSIMSLGLAPFIMQITNSLVQIACNNVLMQVGGSLYVSVMTIISSVRSILDVPVLAITEGASPIISFNYGAGKGSLVVKAIRVVMCIALPYTLLTWLLILWRPQMFIRIFSTDPELMADAVRGLRLYFAAFIFQSFQYSGQTVFKALGKKKQAIFFSLLRKAVLVVPLTFILPYAFRLGTDGVFLAEPVSNVIGGLACFTTMVLMMRADPHVHDSYSE